MKFRLAKKTREYTEDGDKPRNLWNADQWTRYGVKLECYVEDVVRSVGTKRIMLYGKLKGCNKIHESDHRILGYKDGKLVDISLLFVIEKYSECKVCYTEEDITKLETM